MNNEARQKLEWLNMAMKTKQMKATPLAKAANIAPSTILRFLSDPENENPPRDTTLNTIAFAHGLTQYSGKKNHHSGGFQEDGAAPLTPVDIGGEKEFIHLKQTYNMFDDECFWVMRGDALENVGIFDGTILIVDIKRQPKEGDIVCLSLRDEENMTAKTIFRLYIAKDPVGVCAIATNNPTIRPLMHFVDGVKVAIYGVVSMSLRKH